MQEKLLFLAKNVPSPCFILDETLLENNLKLIQEVAQKADIEIILAFKGFALWQSFPLLKQYINGATASSLHEARLCFEEMKTKAHSYLVVFNPDEFEEIANYSSHISFNSLNQFNLYKERALAKGISCGLRVNPLYSEVTTDLYNPCSATSRLGIQPQELSELPDGVEGLHFHALCESDSFTLEKTLAAFEQNFGHLLHQIKWVNMGGGHLMTKTGYDTDHLIKLLQAFKQKYNVHVILEPGSAFAWQTGWLMAHVRDIISRGGVNYLLPNISFTAHMPDCLEMPYQPKILGASNNINQNKFIYAVGGNSCLAGDHVPLYAFEQEIKIDDPLFFDDMIHYTMVKSNTFNGVKHPAIAILKKDGSLKICKEFDYFDYKNRLS